MKFSAFAPLLLGTGLLAACNAPMQGEMMTAPAPAVAAAPSSMRAEMAAPARNAAADSAVGMGDVALARAPVVQNRPGLGTAMGEITSAPTRIVTSERVNPMHPNAVATIRYNSSDAMTMARRELSRDPVAVKVLENGRACTMEVALRGSYGRIYPMGPQYTPDNQFHAMGESGQTYTISITNTNCASTYETVTTVDGLDVMTGQPGSVRNGGYLLEPGRTVQITGFRVSNSNVATFKFDSVANSYAARPGGDARNVGVIGIALFAQRSGTEAVLRSTANPFPADRPRP